MFWPPGRRIGEADVTGALARGGGRHALASAAVPSTSPPAAPARARSGARASLVALVLALVLLAGCQVQVQVDTVVDQNGAGTVTVAVGLDEAARNRIGDLQVELQVGDLRQAGWEVAEPAAGADGVTWIRASKPFSNPDQLTAVLAEIAGPDTMFTDVEYSRTETDDDITYRVTGQVDLTKGVATFADPELAAQLGGDPFGGNLAAIEAEEGKPVSEMVSFQVTTQVAGGIPSTVRPTLTDTAPTPIDVATVEVKPPSPLIRIAIGAAIVIGIVVVVAALVGVRRRVSPGR
jgi:hypothetical protein